MQHHAFYNMKQGSITLMTAILGGLLFMLLHIPVPWLLGPMVTMVIVTNVMKRTFVWHVSIRNIGMMIIGYVIGLSMTTEALHDMVRQLPSMVLMTLLLLLFSAGVAFIISKLSNHDYNTSLLASMPGGLTQIVILAEETKGINLAIVTVTQVIRLMLIIITMPLIVMLPIFQSGDGESVNSVAETASSVSLFPNIIPFAILGIILTAVGLKIKFPTAQLIAPMLGTMLLQISGFEGPELPGILTNISQLMIGTHVGLMLNARDLPGKARTIGLALVSGIMLIIGSVILTFSLVLLQPISSATGMLGMAPGGMDQMGIIAHAIGADLSIVSGYQLFRTLVIFFALPPFVKWFFNFTEQRKQKRKKQQRRTREKRIQEREAWTHK